MKSTTNNDLLSATFPDQLHTLCDGRLGLRRPLHVESTSPSDKADLHVIDFISSDESLDRYDEIVSATGWELAAYRRNPVFQNSHQYGDIIFTLGRALVTEVRIVGGKSVLYQRIEFATTANPIARIAYALYKDHFLNAVSVGFVPLEWEDAAPGSRHRRRYLRQELLEVSAVAIPANPNALALALKSGSIQKADLRASISLLETLSASAQFSTSSAPLTPQEQLFQLARDIRDLMKSA